VNLDEKDEKRYEKMFQPVYETKLATYVRAVHSKRQLLERMTEFWHDHFNIHPDRDERIAPGWAWFDRDVIRANAFGNFGKMLEAVATSPAMLMYLDNASSSRGGPNENFSRELFELHTLGAENYFGVKRQDVIAKDATGLPVGYVDDDVYEATRAFTGWRLSENKDEPGLGNTGKFVTASKRKSSDGSCHRTNLRSKTAKTCSRCWQHIQARPGLFVASSCANSSVMTRHSA
jgi:uncharacterized protein (DUF1800 family)